MNKSIISKIIREYMPFFVIPIIILWVYFAIESKTFLGVLGNITGLGFSIIILSILQDLDN